MPETPPSTLQGCKSSQKAPENLLPPLPFCSLRFLGIRTFQSLESRTPKPPDRSKTSVAEPFGAVSQWDSSCTALILTSETMGSRKRKPRWNSDEEGC